MKTSKMMIAAILLCGTSLSAQAQDYYETKNEIAISVGAGTSTQLFDVYSKMSTSMGQALISAIFSGGHYVSTTSYEDKAYVPPISVEYFHHFGKVVGVGGIVAFNSNKQDIYYNTGKNVDGVAKTIDKEKVGNASKYFITVMPAVKFDWLRKKNVGLYSKVAFGLTYFNEKQKDSQDKGKDFSDSGIRFNYHVSLIGVEVGSTKLRGFTELGMGEQGIVQAGIRCKF